jgi:hypothetical protein
VSDHNEAEIENNLKRDYERIYLTDELGEVTWCQDRITKHDVEYIRSDLAQAPHAPVSREAIEKALEGTLDYQGTDEEWAMIIDKLEALQLPSPQPSSGLLERAEIAGQSGKVGVGGACAYTAVHDEKMPYPRKRYMSSCGLEYCLLESEVWTGDRYEQRFPTGNCMKCGKSIHVAFTTPDTSKIDAAGSAWRGSTESGAFDSPRFQGLTVCPSDIRVNGEGCNPSAGGLRCVIRGRS